MTNARIRGRIAYRLASRGGWRRASRRHVGMLALLAIGGMGVLGGTGCSLDSLLKSDKLPDGVSDPSVTQTAAGAWSAYNGTVAAFRKAFGDNGSDAGLGAFVAQAGLLSDELQMARDGGEVDRRALPDGILNGVEVYSALQKARGQAAQAVGLLTRYRPGDSALTGHLYALEGYAEVFLAELFCSGIPLSTLDYAGDYTPKPGSTTTEVFTHAIALFDTALVLTKDSARFLDLARIGRARALLALGGDTGYAAAATAAAPVADAYRYAVEYNTVAYNSVSGSGAAQNFFAVDGNGNWLYTIPDREGSNGLDWRTSGDLRTQAVSMTGTSGPFYHPIKYAATGDSAIVLASGVEARLIEAEAALQAGSTAWLTKLNALRTDGTFDEQPTPDPNDDPAATDTLWHAGTGGVAGLAPLADPDPSAAPGPTNPRVDLLFRERAFWLFLTGHRQGDLRRLIRQYVRTQSSVYPVGFYQGTSDFTQLYGENVEIPTPEQNNPLYTGCASRGA